MSTLVVASNKRRKRERIFSDDTEDSDNDSFSLRKERKAKKGMKARRKHRMYRAQRKRKERKTLERKLMNKLFKLRRKRKGSDSYESFQSDSSATSTSSDSFISSDDSRSFVSSDDSRTSADGRRRRKKRIKKPSLQDEVEHFQTLEDEFDQCSTKSSLEVEKPILVSDKPTKSPDGLPSKKCNPTEKAKRETDLQTKPTPARFETPTIVKLLQSQNAVSAQMTQEFGRSTIDNSKQSPKKDAHESEDDLEFNHHAFESDDTKQQEAIDTQWNENWTVQSLDITNPDAILRIWRWFHSHATRVIQITVSRNGKEKRIQHKEHPNFIMLGAALLLHLHAQKPWRPLKLGRAKLSDFDTITHPRLVSHSKALLMKFEDHGQFLGRYKTAENFIDNFTFGAMIGQVKRKFRMPEDLPTGYFDPENHVFSGPNIYGINHDYCHFFQLMQVPLE